MVKSPVDSRYSITFEAKSKSTEANVLIVKDVKPVYLTDLGYDVTLKNASRIRIDLRLQCLYAKKAKPGAVRVMMLQLMKHMAELGLAKSEDVLCLEASGHVNGKFEPLVAMYERMSFVKLAEMVDEDAHPQVISSVLMKSTFGEVLDHLARKFE